MPEYRINDQVDTILCDIEGTTTSISFVKDCLFPYIRENLKNYLIENYDKEQCKEDLKLLIEQSKIDLNSFGNNEVPIIVEDWNEKDLVIESVIKNVFWQMDMDRKAKPLKQLQGHMWRDAYERGSIKGHVYDDVVPAFESWIEHGYKIYIYSSGSIEAQKLLFGFSDKGNILKYFSGHYDTNIGLKVESTSYENILKSLNKNGENVLFLTDMIREVEAATKANISCCLLRRSDNPDKETNFYEWVNDFSQIKIRS